MLIDRKALLRILILTILFTSAGTFVLWDYYRVDRDFSALKALLQAMLLVFNKIVKIGEKVTLNETPH